MADINPNEPQPISDPESHKNIPNTRRPPADWQVPDPIEHPNPYTPGPTNPNPKPDPDMPGENSDENEIG